MADKPKLKDIISIAKSTAQDILQKKVESVISIEKIDDIWEVIVEVLERKAIPDTQDLIGKYEMTFDLDGELVRYRRIELRRRGNLEIIEDEV